MNTPQKFFGFLLLPILTFVLGVSLSGNLETSFREKKPLADKNTEILKENETVDTAIFHTALQEWRKHADDSAEPQLQQFEAAIAQTETFLAGFQKVDFHIFWEAMQKIQEKYIDPAKIDFEKISEGVIRGLVFSLEDSYSTYLSVEESQAFNDEIGGELEGIGAELTLKNGFITVVSPLKDSPAAAAGILPEDIIMQVDGEDIETQSLEAVVKKIRGPRNTEVTLTIVRRGEPIPLEKTITRAHIIVESVSLEMRDEVAILEVSQFGDNTEEEFLRYLREALTKGPKGIVLDLRFNPGGYLETAVDMVSAFQEEGKVVIQKERAPSVVNRFVTRNKITDLPLVVLINAGSASAAEIVAGALQDHDRALILGETSFGKGTVQQILPLSDGSNLRLTIARWLTPQGRDIAEKGIEPDILILRTAEDFEQDRDPQLDAAIQILTGEAQPEEFTAEGETEEAN